MSMEYVGVPLRVTANAIDRNGNCVLEVPGLDGTEAAGEIITLDAADCARINVAHWLKAELVELVTADAPAAPPAGGKGAADDAAALAAPEDASDSGRKGERGSGSGFRPASDGGRK